MAFLFHRTRGKSLEGEKIRERTTTEGQTPHQMKSSDTTLKERATVSSDSQKKKRRGTPSFGGNWCKGGKLRSASTVKATTPPGQLHEGLPAN